MSQPPVRQPFSGFREPKTLIPAVLRLRRPTTGDWASGSPRTSLAGSLVCQRLKSTTAFGLQQAQNPSSLPHVHRLSAKWQIGLRKAQSATLPDCMRIRAWCKQRVWASQSPKALMRAASTNHTSKLPYGLQEAQKRSSTLTTEGERIQSPVLPAQYVSSNTAGSKPCPCHQCCGNTPKGPSNALCCFKAHFHIPAGPHRPNQLPKQQEAQNPVLPPAWHPAIMRLTCLLMHAAASKPVSAFHLPCTLQIGLQSSRTPQNPITPRPSASTTLLGLTGSARLVVGKMFPPGPCGGPDEPPSYPARHVEETCLPARARGRTVPDRVSSLWHPSHDTAPRPPVPCSVPVTPHRAIRDRHAPWCPAGWR